MNSLPANIFRRGMLFAVAFSIVGGVAAGSAILGGSSIAFAQEMNSATETSSNNKLAGIIASLQIQDVVAPEWVTAGYWELESDAPIFGGGNGSEPMVTNFSGIVEMVRLSNGTFLHEHMLSDFVQTDIVYSAENTTTINGTMTVTTEDGPTEDVPVYITFENNLISIYIDAEATDNHFGPTPILGMILTPEKLQQISELLSDSEGGTLTAGQQNATSLGSSALGNATGQ
jgi:hypothetical protein